MNELMEIISNLWISLQAMPPWIFFLTMALVCVAPVPITPFYLAAGPLFGIGPALLWISPAVLLNQWLAFALASGVLRPAIAGLLARRGHRIPHAKTAHQQSILTLIVRITPAIPYVFQSWILGLAGIDRTRFLLISWPIQMGYAIAWVSVGQSAFEGRFGLASVAVAALIGLMLFARWIRMRLRNAGENFEIENQL